MLHLLDVSPDAVPDLLVANLPRDLVMGIEDALTVGSRRAFEMGRDADRGHAPSVVGQMRHFRMNEAFHSALEASGANPSPIRGNNLVLGQAGIFTLSRFNIPLGAWNNGRRSQLRKQLSTANVAIEQLVQPQLFGAPGPITEAVAFFVSCFTPSLRGEPEVPDTIELAVPDRTMKHWIFREPLKLFLQRYDQTPAQQVDLARPVLKRDVSRLADGTGR